MAIEHEISFPSGSLQLAGTVRRPETGGPFPGVVLIPGSGQVDRNENARKLAINAFREIATDLGEKGIATLRYDKRGVGESQGDFWTTGFYDNVSDAAAALHVLRSNEYIRPDHIYLLGHSEGAVIATRLAASGAEIAGVVLLAGTARPGEQVLSWQSQQIVRTLGGINRFLINLLHIDVQKAQQKQIEKIKHSTQDSYRVQLVTRINAKWMREFLAHDPAGDLSKIRVPVLAITGSKDIQVNPDDLRRMAELVQSEIEWHEVPDLNHILRKEAGAPTLSTYKQQVRRPVDQRVLRLISDWLRRHGEKQLLSPGSAFAGHAIV